MTDYKMTPAIQRVLCRLIGRKWHEAIGLSVTPNYKRYDCSCGESHFFPIDEEPIFNLSFTRPSDAHRVMQAIEAKGLLADFCFSLNRCNLARFSLPANSTGTTHYFIRTDVLLDPERFCVLAGEFWKERRVNNV